MKAKLGKLAYLKKFKYAGYKALLKKSVLSILETETQTCKYLLLPGEQLDWQCGGGVPEKPFLYLDLNYEGIKKDVKAEKLDLKAYSYGTCQLRREGADVVIALSPEKGKLTQPALLKPISKTLKKFKPKVFLEVVDGEQHPHNPEGTNTTKEQKTGQPPKQAVVKTIGTNLIKFHKEAKITKHKLSELDKQDPIYQETRVRYQKILHNLQKLCQSWKTQVVDSNDKKELVIEELWTKAYQFWESRFEQQQQKIKEAQKKDTQGNRLELQEAQAYNKAVDVFQALEAKLDGDKLDLAAVEKDLLALEKALHDWQAVVNGQTSTAPEELAALEDIVKNYKAELATAKEHNAWVNSLTAQEKARAKVEGQYYEAARKALEQFNKDLDNFDVTNPSKIVSDIAGLEQHLQDWKNAVGGQAPIYAKDLQAMEAALERITNDWAEMAPRLDAYNAKYQALDEAIAANDTEKTTQLIEELEAFFDA